MDAKNLGFLGVKVVAVSVRDRRRAWRFYGETLGLEPAMEGGEQVGFQLGAQTLMPKDDYAQPTDLPNPRITLAVEDARGLEEVLAARGVRIADPVTQYGEFFVGSFLDSEGNKLWFCSPVQPPP